MISIFKHIKLVIKHKWFVFLAGLRTKAPLYLLIIHDWTKLSPAEAPYYAKQFFGKECPPLDFSKAWNHHQKANPHHWEYWVMITGHNRGGYPDGSILPMPEKYVREMIADWLGASRAYEGKWPQSLETWQWWQKNFDNIKLHPDTRELVLKIAKNTFNKI